MDTWPLIGSIATFLVDVTTLFAYGWAIWVFFARREEVASILRNLRGYALGLSTNQLIRRLDRLDELHVDEQVQDREIGRLFAQIKGQINGNDVLRSKCAGILKRLDGFLKIPKRHTEAVKAELTSEIRETLNGLNLETYSAREA